MSEEHRGFQPSLPSELNGNTIVALLPTKTRRSGPENWVVDLFCGAGGLAEGFRLAGYETALGVDLDPAACETFSKNHPESAVLQADVGMVDPHYLLELAGVAPGQLSVLCGGPPCQGFSVAGKRLQDDPRNFLYKQFLRAVEAFQPECVVMENVPSLLKHSAVPAAIQRDFSTLNVQEGRKYVLRHKIVNSADYGVPQTRRRVLFVAIREDVNRLGGFSLDTAFEPVFARYPDLFGRPRYVTVADAIDDLPYIQAGEGAEELLHTQPAHTPYQALMRGELSLIEYSEQLGIPTPLRAAHICPSSYVYNHLAQNHSPLLVERFDNIPPGGTKEDLRRTRPDLLPPEGHPEQGLTYGRLWLDRAAPTIPANFSRPSGNRSIHPRIPRMITPREAMRLSSFPDAYRLYGGKVAQREQVGNAVPPLLAFHLANQITRQLGKVTESIS